MIIHDRNEIDKLNCKELEQMILSLKLRIEDGERFLNYLAPTQSTGRKIFNVLPLFVIVFVICFSFGLSFLTSLIIAIVTFGFLFKKGGFDVSGGTIEIQWENSQKNLERNKKTLIYAQNSYIEHCNKI